MESNIEEFTKGDIILELPYVHIIISKGTRPLSLCFAGRVKKMSTVL